MFEAVGAAAGGAVVDWIADFVQDGFACFLVALLVVSEEGRAAWERGCGVVEAGAFTGPFAFFGAFVGGLGAVVEAERSFARFTAEREEVEDMAIL